MHKKKVSEFTAQDTALTKALDEEKSLSGAIRRIKGIAKQFPEFDKTLTAVQRVIIESIEAQIIQHVFTPTQLSKWNRETVKRFKIILDDDSVRTGFKSIEKAKEHMQSLKVVYKPTVFKKLKVSEYDHQLERKFSVKEICARLQHVDKQFNAVYINTDKPTIAQIKRAVGMGISEAERAKLKAEAKKRMQSKKDKANATSKVA